MCNNDIVSYSYSLAKKTDEFVLSVVSGFDVVPRMTVRGLGHLIVSVADMIENSQHTKHGILCCTGCFHWEPEISIEETEARLAATLDQLKLPLTESSDEDDDKTDQAVLTTRPQNNKMVKKPVLREMAFLMTKNEVATIVEGSESERDPMLFTPGRIIHMEVVEFDAMKKLVQKPASVSNRLM